MVSKLSYMNARWAVEGCLIQKPSKNTKRFVRKSSNRKEKPSTQPLIGRSSLKFPRYLRLL
jgi:hypothetical protein